MAHTHDMRYLESREKFAGYAFDALAGRFATRADLETFVDRIECDIEKNLFLRTAAFYLFLVKNGKWVLDHSAADTEVEYFTVTYKYIAIFSLIESLAPRRHVEFYDYLMNKQRRQSFPITDYKALESLYGAYKREYGAVSSCVQFFQRLPQDRQAALVAKLEIEGAEPSIEELAKYLYRLRSQYVHSCELVHEICAGPHLSLKGGQVVFCRLQIEDAMDFFEEGLIAHFAGTETAQP